MVAIVVVIEVSSWSDLNAAITESFEGLVSGMALRLLRLAAGSRIR